MSTSSGLGASISETTRGSSAMPQIGQEPAASRTISGCIGQVYSVFVNAAGFERSGSSAIPQFGQAPGRSDRTSGSIGQMKISARRRRPRAVAPARGTRSGSSQSARDSSDGRSSRSRPGTVRADGVGLLDFHPADRIDVGHRVPSITPSRVSMIGHWSVDPSAQQCTRCDSACFIACSSAIF